MDGGYMTSNPLIYWVSERESIRKKKELRMLPPWSVDPIFTYRFTNVRRRDDRVSRWLRKYILTEENIKVDMKSFLMFSAFCRWVNWPPTIKEILDAHLFPSDNIDWKKVIKVMATRSGAKQKIWTGAYMVRADSGWGQQPKYVGIIEEVILKSMNDAADRIMDQLLGRTRERRQWWLLLQEHKYFGSFMAGQVIDDYTWTSLLNDAPDLYTWAPQGPGSLRGFNRLLNLPLKTKHDETEWCTQLQAWRQQIISELGKEYEDLDLMSTQSCLCEVDKYLRVKNGEGRPRSKYRPETAY